MHTQHVLPGKSASIRVIRLRIVYGKRLREDRTFGTAMHQVKQRDVNLAYRWTLLRHLILHHYDLLDLLDT
jgi:hypothetical protein